MAAAHRHHGAVVVLSLLFITSLQIFGFVGKEVSRWEWGQAGQEKHRGEKARDQGLESSSPPKEKTQLSKIAPVDAQESSKLLQGKGSESRGTSFVAFRHRSATTPAGSRCPSNAQEPQAESARPLQVPEANYLTMLAAKGCLEEGCSLEDNQEIQGKLARDEARIRLSIHQEMRAMHHQASQQPDSADGDKEQIAWMQWFVSSSRSVRQKLKQMTSVQNSDFAKQFVASLAFGSGLTGQGSVSKREKSQGYSG
mmetsp:Transcript_50278/g.81483  ORF Transcript_50278/g.81483 Transcript_50278/m.81483 type:complete len:254 (+) Transcript_50278:72-833(+)